MEQKVVIHITICITCIPGIIHPMFQEILRRSNFSRTGELDFGSMKVKTPTFMPVGTQGTVKGLTPDQVRATGARIVLGNTYHLHLQPGESVIAKAGGLAAFS